MKPDLASNRPPESSPLGADERLLTPDEVATILVVPVHTLAKWRSQRTGPLPLTVGKHVRYRRLHVNAWLAEKEGEAHDWMAN